MSILLDENSKVIVQGMTDSDGRKHSQRMLDSGTNIVGGVNPRKAGQSVAIDGGTEVPVLGSVTGMTSAEWLMLSQRMVDAGTNIVGGVSARKAGQAVAFEGGTEVAVFGGGKEAMEATGANVSVVFVPPKFAKSAALEVIDA